MTTTVRVNAHCPEDYEVVVRIDADDSFKVLVEHILQDKQDTTVYVTSNQTLMVWERPK